MEWMVVLLLALRLHFAALPATHESKLLDLLQPSRVLKVGNVSPSSVPDVVASSVWFVSWFSAWVALCLTCSQETGPLCCW